MDRGRGAKAEARRAAVDATELSYSAPRTANTAGELHVALHDRRTLRMDRAEIPVEIDKSVHQ